MNRPQRIPACRQAIGVDVGGTKVAMGLVGADGTVGPTVRFENREAPGARELLALTAERCRRLLRDARGGTVVAIGLGLPELVDLDGRIRSSTSIAWTREEILEAFGGSPPVVLEADVRAAALAEARFGAGRGYRSVAYVTIGTGISSCHVLDGRPLAGGHGAAQLLGSTEVAARCPACGEHFPLVLERVAAGPGIAAAYARATGWGVERAEEVVAAESRGDLAAIEVLEEAAQVLGSFLALLVGVVDPEVLVLGGGIGASAGPYVEAVVRWARRYIWAEHVRGLPIRRAALGSAAGMIGAGVAALEAVREEVR